MISFISEKLKQNKIKFSNLKFLTGDASPRRYFLLNYRNRRSILMYDDDPENLLKYINLTENLNNIVSVPKIFIDLKEESFVILENFKFKYSEILHNKNKKKLYKLALDALIHIHDRDLDFKLPKYSKDIFLGESNLFFEWYLKTKKNKEEIFEIKSSFNNLFNNYLKKVFLLPKVFIHRDYHVDNLFYLNQRESHLRCGWIDYQDALVGPCVYDLVSLTQDARIDVEKKIEGELIENYLEKFRLIDKDLFLFSYTVIAIQRHLKVLGIFSRLATRDKKTIYLQFLPRVKKLLLKNLQVKEFFPLLKIIKPLLDIQNDK